MDIGGSCHTLKWKWDILHPAPSPRRLLRYATQAIQDTCTHRTGLNAKGTMPYPYRKHAFQTRGAEIFCSKTRGSNKFFCGPPKLGLVMNIIKLTLASANVTTGMHHFVHTHSNGQSIITPGSSGASRTIEILQWSSPCICDLETNTRTTWRLKCTGLCFNHSLNMSMYSHVTSPPMKVQIRCACKTQYASH